MVQAATNRFADFANDAPFTVCNAGGNAPLVLVCEHASNSVPSHLIGQLTSDEALQSHAGWDPGALEVATRLSERFDAPLVAGTTSRLVYDLNRPPSSSDCIRTSSELFEIPGNVDLSAADRAARVSEIYAPFHQAVADTLQRQWDRADTIVLITIHTFAPVYFGKERMTQIGILHDADSRFADIMLDGAGNFTDLKVARNEPYTAADGVTHTLQKHALPTGLLNVMIEVRNDLVETPDQQDDIADVLARMIGRAMQELGVVDVSASRERA